jgi:putative PIN family toxin of toxin-antitoxin system
MPAKCRKRLAPRAGLEGRRRPGSSAGLQHHRKDLRGLERRPVPLLPSEPILAEVEDVLVRPEILRKLRMTPVEAAALIELLKRQSTLVTPSARITRSRDPDDDKFLECAAAGAADYIVSADADLLSLGEVNGILIIDALAFSGVP